MSAFLETLDTLAATPEKVRLLVTGADEVALSRRPPGDFFSLRENVAHLRDVDIDAYEQRVERVLGEEHPVLADFKGAQVAKERAYHLQAIAPALEAFIASRARSVARLRAAGEGALGRTAQLEGVGEVTLGRILELWIQHDREHLADMEALRNAS
jgi:DinB superfamily